MAPSPDAPATLAEPPADIRPPVPESGPPPDSAASKMRVRKRNGSFEPVDVMKIVRAVDRCCDGLADVDPLRVATKTISGLYDGATTAELDRLSIQTAAALIAEEPRYSRLAARLLASYIDKEVRIQELYSFPQSIRAGHELGLIADTTAAFVTEHRRKLHDAIDPTADQRFEYFGLRTLYDRYLIRHPETRLVVETPQYFLLRVACGLAQTPAEAIEFYRLMSSLAYLPSSPTLFNSGTTHPQMSSCYLLDSPRDELDAIYESFAQVAKLSKFAGGIGISWSRVRCRGSLIRGIHGPSSGIVPFLKIFDASVAAVNRVGRRRGAACVYLEPWHADIEEFLELRDNTGEESRRTHNLNLANWIPDLFMRRVQADAVWSLFDPKEVPQLVDLWGEEFDAAYEAAEAEGRYARQLPARELYTAMLRTLAQTGNGWMTFKDAANRTCNQTARAENVVHLSNLCTEILEVTSDVETAVCNLGSINLAAHVREGAIDRDKLAATVRTTFPFLDRVIDLNFYPSSQAAASNARWRAVGLGMMGLQDALFRLGLPFDSPPARAISRQVAEDIYFHALSASCELAEQFGPHPAYSETRAADGMLQFDLWGVKPDELAEPERWEALRQRIRAHGLRNSLVVAIAPTANIGSIAGCSECIEPQVANTYKRETLSGEFLQINPYLVADLKARGLWTEQVRTAIKQADGSVQHIPEIPDDLKAIYRTAWELPQRSLIDMAAERGPFIDQSQSLNLFMATPTIGKLASMYTYAWQQGLKTTYYLRSRPATRINQTTVYEQADAESCSLENPEECEACQ